MPDDTPPPVSEGTVRPAPQALTGAHIDAVLADFRSWLEQLASSPTFPSETVADAVPTAAPPDLHTLLGQFTALRHEVNLQTRASRVQQEQNAETLRQLGEALEALERSQEAQAERRESEQEEISRPLLKTLVDIYDALALARREIQRVREAVLPELDQLKERPLRLAEQFDKMATTPIEPSWPVDAVATVPEPRRSFWGRLFGKQNPAALPATGPSLEQQRQEQCARERQEFQKAQALELQELAARLEQGAGRVQQMLAALLAGYTMSIQRVERALQQFQLEPIPAVGQPFDPERMEVVEVLIEPGRETTEVIEEVRRGYLWQGRVFRYAQVRVARGEV